MSIISFEKKNRDTSKNFYHEISGGRGFTRTPNLTMFRSQIQTHRYTSSNLVFGFTLIELMISLALFTMVIVSGVTALVTSQASARRAEAGRAVMDNLNFAIENLSRNGRLGYDYTCINNQDIAIDIDTETDFPNSSFGADCVSGTALVFKVLNIVTGIIDIYGYQLATTTHPISGLPYTYLERCISKEYISGSIFTWECSPITASTIDLYNLVFIVTGVTTEGQPSAHLFIDGVSTVENESSSFRVQTFLSQRQFKY